MKKTILLSILLLLAEAATMKVKGQDKMISADELPTKSREFLNTHFKGMEISYVEVDKELLWTEGYEVILTDGTEINFNRNGEWKEVDCRRNPVPTAIIPKEITLHVAKNFPDREILAIEKETRKWEIKLNGRMELTFDTKYRLIDMDMD
jgi:hypothetical protein